jgi:hypothetical protein
MATLTGRDKLRPLLPHWIEHKAGHAADFRLWAGLASDIEAAAARMEAANEDLAAALAKPAGSTGNHVHRQRHDR